MINILNNNYRTAKFLEFWKIFINKKSNVVGLILVILFVGISIIGQFYTPHDPFEIGRGERFESPNSEFLMGTDDLGRDIFSRVLVSGKVSMMVGVFAAGLSTVFGVIMGAISGYKGGVLDDIIMRTTDLFQMISRIFLSMILVAFFGPSIFNVVIAIGILSWPSIARQIRSQFLSLKNEMFVESARVTGASNVRIIFNEILPNVTATIIVNFSYQIARAILTEAVLSFLGLGDPKNISWGVMLRDSQRYLRFASWMSIFPGLMILLTVSGINLVGDGLNDILNPRRTEYVGA